MPAHLKGGIVKLGLIAVLKVVDECAKGRVSNKFVIRIGFLLVSSLVVNTIPFCLIENHSSEIPQSSGFELFVYLFDQGSMLEGGRIYNL